MLHPDLLTRPFAHRGLHGPGVPENSMAAFRAAVARGYGIELDVQPAADGTPLVFHDDGLRRLTGREGVIAALAPAEAAATRLMGTAETIPTLAAVLDMVAGRAPVLVEIKDQDGTLGPRMGALPGRVAGIVAACHARGQPVAVMSFNPHAVAGVRAAAPEVAVGLTSCGFARDDWPGVPEARRAALARLDKAEAVGAGFISHDHRDLANPAVGRLAARGVPVLAWTICSPDEEAAARRVARNITFEGYLPRQV